MAWSVDEPLFCGLIRAVLPNGGWVVALSHVYIDESGTHDGSPIMTMAGYLFKSEQAHRFTRDWAKDLRRFNLSCAHMTDCANGNGEYKKLSREERLASEKLLIAHIKRRSVFGFSVSVDPAKYLKLLSDEPDAPTPYSFCVLGCMTVIRRWIACTGYTGKVAYFFEAGHQHQGEANRHMNAIPARGEESMRRFAYVSHAFVDKREAPPLQAADMLAWQYHHFHCRKRTGHKQPRKDFLALIRPGDVALDYVDDHLSAFKDTFTKDVEELKATLGAAGPQWPGKVRTA